MHTHHAATDARSHTCTYTHTHKHTNTFITLSPMHVHTLAHTHKHTLTLTHSHAYTHADGWSTQGAGMTFDTRNHEHTQVNQTLIRAYFSPAFTTGQRFIYAGSADKCIYMWDVVTGASAYVCLCLLTPVGFVSS